MRSISVKTNAIVIKRLNYRDTDKLVTLYTEELGKIVAIAKGMRKMNSKARSHLELLNLSKVELIESHGRYIITHAETISTFAKIKSSYEKISESYYILELLDKLSPEDEQNPILYNFLVKTIETLNEIDSPHLLNAYNVKIIKILGYYAESNLRTVDPKLVNYTRNLVRVRYSDLDRLHCDEDTRKQTFLLFKNYTEEILEREVKSHKNLI